MTIFGVKGFVQNSMLSPSSRLPFLSRGNGLQPGVSGSGFMLKESGYAMA